MTVKIAIDDSTGRSKKDNIRIEIVDARYTNGTNGYPGILNLLFFVYLNLNTPITARIGNIPREKPI